MTEEAKIRYIEDRLKVTEEQAILLCKYHALMTEKNLVMNLTRITEFEESVEKHFDDSLRLLSYYNIEPEMKVLDLGSGAGLPVFPLAVVCPDVAFFSVDTVGKKIRFQEETAAEMGLCNITCIKGRAEDLSRDKRYREQFDLVTARAMAPLPVLLEYALPFLKVGGTLAAYKTESIQEEIALSKNALRLLGGQVKDTFYYQVGENKRSILLVEKEKHTPAAYPRKAGTPSKSPL